MIPRTIYQTFINTISLPDDFKNNIEHIKALNPGWHHVVYDDIMVDNFVRSEGWPELIEQYNRLQHWISKIDVFKYLLIYKNGGVYLDIKSTLNKPLDSVLLDSDQYILSQWQDPANPELHQIGKFNIIKHVPGGEYQQWFIAATPGHPFLKAVLDRVIEHAKQYDIKNGVGKYPVLLLAGPIPYTLAIHPIKDQHPHRKVLAYSDLGFQYSIYKNFVGHIQHFPNHYSLSKLPLII